jgi:pimeloyl-ACP methyl ester carboxylesterase
MLSSRASPKHRALCDDLARRGLLALRFDFAGRGESEGETAEITYERQVEDLDAAVGAARVVTDRIGLVGSSMGGAVALLFARNAPDVRCVAGIAAVGRPRVVLERLAGAVTVAGGGMEIEGARLGPGLVRSALETDVVSAARALRCPLLLVHGALDCVVPLDQAIELRGAAAAGRLEVIPDGDHLLHRPEDQLFLERVVGGFMASHLGAAVP